MNAETSVQWAPALVVLGAGLIVGFALVWRLLSASRRAVKVGAAALEARDLAGKSEMLFRQLRELEDTASKRTPEQLARERYALELEAAKALLELEKKGPSVTENVASAKAKAANPEPSVATPSVATRDRTGMRGFLWGVGSAAGVLLLGFFVYQSARPREAGGSVTGNTPMASGPMASKPSGGEAADGEEAQLQAAVARNPSDVEGHLALARLYVEKQNWMGVWNETARVLERSPSNSQALGYQSLVRLAMGQTDVAVTLLTKALASDPDMIDGYAYLALAYTRMGRARDADATIAKASKRFPQRAADFQKYLTDLREKETPVAQASAAGANPNPHAGVKTPGGDKGAPAPQQTASTVRHVSGTVDVDPSLRGKLPASGVLFVFARPAGGSEGPPVAVKRLPARFPATFELSEADSMMGQPLPDQLLIEARLDEDGDPTTRPPTDPKARLDGVKVGRTDLRLVLKRP
ncbi:MAG: tetratricopeptide repeat protein [Deltaproteobacteria bacterium]|nr:MAG: tetratricopeptide repeat protein [Deltaproteobacteria bacterium]